jgi:site-specific recombinase XerD
MKRRREDDQHLLAPLVKDFFDWSMTERKMSGRTIQSYRDAMVLFLRHLADSTKTRVENLTMPEDLADHALAFLRMIESKRGVSIATRNHRLSVIKSFARFVAYREPLLATACRRVAALPAKKDEEKLLDYIEPEDMEEIIAAAAPNSVWGRRDRAMLLLLYNTGCRASELAGLAIDDVILDRPRHVRILGKGRRWRTVPLWERTMTAIQQMLADRRGDARSLFVGQRQNALTRYGVRGVVKKYARAVAARRPELTSKRLSPHTVRHTTAVALLRTTGDIDAVSKVLGHASLNTTRIYTGKDRSQVAKTLDKIAQRIAPTDAAVWTPSDDLLGWLEAL